MKTSKTPMTISPVLIIILLIALPLIGFYIGAKTHTEQMTNVTSQANTPSAKRSLPSFEEQNKLVISPTVVEPKEMTNTFYTWYLSCIDTHFEASDGNSPNQDCPYQVSPLVTKNLVDQLAKK